jgi:hypothetical protein
MSCLKCKKLGGAAQIKTLSNDNYIIQCLECGAKTKELPFDLACSAWDNGETSGKFERGPADNKVITELRTLLEMSYETIMNQRKEIEELRRKLYESQKQISNASEAQEAKTP